jgi:hypothetical protein
MAALVNENFTKHLGDDFIIQFTIDDVPTLDGFYLRWVMCEDTPAEVPDSPLLLDKSNQGGSPQVYTLDNYAFVIIPSSDTDAQSAIAAGSYYHELHGLDGDGEGGVLGSGIATFLPTRIGR